MQPWEFNRGPGRPRWKLRAGLIPFLPATLVVVWAAVRTLL